MVGLSGSALGCPQQGRDRGWEGIEMAQGRDRTVLFLVQVVEEGAVQRMCERGSKKEEGGSQS